MKSIITIVFTLFAFTLLASVLPKETKELLKNESFGVSYCLSNDTITIKIEDFKDFERNHLYADYSARITVDWFGKGETFLIEEVGLDGCIFEFDCNYDGKIGIGDKGFYMAGMEGISNKGTAYYTSTSYTPMSKAKLNAEIELFSGSRITDSKFVFNNNCGFSNDFYPNSKNVVYELRVPVEEIMNLNTNIISFRVILDRASSKIQQGVEYKTFVLPLGQDAFYDEDDKFFQIDLSKSDAKGVKELLERQRIAKQEKEQKRAEFVMLRKLISTEKLKNAKKVLPKFDGFYIETVNGLYIEVPRQPCNFCKLWNKKDGTSFLISKLSKVALNPYYSEEDFDSLKYIQVEVGKIKNMWVMAGGELKKAVDNLSLHEIKKFSLYPLDGSQNILYKEAPSSNVWHGGLLKNSRFYWFENPRIELNREVGDGFYYKYLPANPLKENTIYGAWANRFIWVFEVIPNKAVAKPKAK